MSFYFYYLFLTFISVFVSNIYLFVSIYSSALTAVFSLLQMMLIFQINKTYLHMNNYLFSLGDDVISAYISGIQFLPVCLMYSSLCPEGAEGSAYAMLTTFGNVALVCASSIGNLLSKVISYFKTSLRYQHPLILPLLHNLLTTSYKIICHGNRLSKVSS